METSLLRPLTIKAQPLPTPRPSKTSPTPICREEFMISNLSMRIWIRIPPHHIGCSTTRHVFQSSASLARGIDLIKSICVDRRRIILRWRLLNLSGPIYLGGFVAVTRYPRLANSCLAPACHQNKSEKKNRASARSRFITRKVSEICAVDVMASLAITRPKPKRRFPWPNFPSTWLRIASSAAACLLSAAETCFGGRPRGGPLSRIPCALQNFRLAWVR